ncbi:MAG: hypothetical protein HUU50_15035 [Candidatus Brocadiae bacterium]|nr:hypothetical protein [Candidatus Brocadiia bacterium]
MFTNRTQIFVTFALIASCIILIMGIEKQLKERKNQYICEGYLRHWRSAFEIYQKEKLLANKIFSWEQKEGWMDSIIENYFFEKDAAFCPSVSHKSQKSYKVNAPIFSQLFLKNDFSSQKIVWVLDGQCSHSHFTSGENPLEDADYRHLGGANVLWSDGSITHQKKEKGKGNR